MKIDKMTIIFVSLIIWAVVSVIYIANDNWQDFKVSYAQRALIQGRQEGANSAYASVGQAAMKQVQDGCKETIPLNLGKDKDNKDVVIELVNKKCLEKPAEAKAEPTEKK